MKTFLVPSVRPPLLERRTFLFPVIGLLIGLGLAADFRSYASADTGFLLDEAARVVDGARPYVDLIDMNTPLTILLNVGAVLIARAIDLPPIFAYRLGVAAVLLASLALTAWLLDRRPQRKRIVGPGILLSAIALFNLPGTAFGEREHLLIALTLPYVMLSGLRVARLVIPVWPAILVGFLAALGFGIKPHFVLLWLAIELYSRGIRRVAPTSVAPESATIAAVLLLQSICVLIWAPEYLDVIGLFAGPYSEFLYEPFWSVVVSGRGALLVVFALLAFIALRGPRQPGFLPVVACAALACLVAGAAQRKGFDYHLYPAFAFGMMLLGLTVWESGGSPRRLVGSVYLVIAVSVLSTTVAYYCVQNVFSAIRLKQDWEERQLERLVQIVRDRAAGQGIYVMSYHIGSAYPLINYSETRSTSRFPQLWILGSSYVEQLKGRRPLSYRSAEEMSASERYLNQAVFEDLRDHQPKLLLVLQPARDLWINGWRRLDYIAYFSRDPSIAPLFQHYQLVAAVEGYLVYERIAEGERRMGPSPTVQVGTRDLVRGPNVGSIPARIRDPGFQVALAAFILTAILAGFAEKGRMSARTARKRAEAIAT